MNPTNADHKKLLSDQLTRITTLRNAQDTVFWAIGALHVAITVGLLNLFAKDGKIFELIPDRQLCFLGALHSALVLLAQYRSVRRITHYEVTAARLEKTLGYRKRQRVWETPDEIFDRGGGFRARYWAPAATAAILIGWFWLGVTR